MARFSKKHYIALAESLKDALTKVVTDEHEYGFHRAYHAVESTLRDDNPRFDSFRFYNAVYNTSSSATAEFGRGRRGIERHA